jgi:MinD-like ATPase involved in chromosome partitioning or flagellar assembly
VSAAVIVAVRAANEAEIAIAIGERAGLSVARRCADLSEAVAAAQAGIGDVVVTSEHGQLDRAVVRRLEKAGLAIVGVPSDARAREAMLGLGILTVLAPGTTAEQVAAAAYAAAMEPRSDPAFPDAAFPDAAFPDASLHKIEEPRARGAMVVVWGPTGAPGRTTIATNLAVEAGRGGADVVLVDADTYGGAVASALGVVDEAPGIAALARAALRGELTEALFARHAVGVAPGVRLVSGISRSDRWPELPAEALDALWESARAGAGLVVVDAGFALERADALGGRDRNAATLSALAAADVIVAVGSSEPLGIQRLVQGLSDLASIPEASEARRVVVVNRVRASVAGASPERAVADALARYASVAETWTVPFDPRACDAAALAGAALAETAPRSAARRAIAELARHVVEVSASVTESTTIA